MADLLLNNRYLLQETLGTGGMAMVYRARDQMLERPVAIKVLREDFSADPEFQARFRQEAKAAANLSHPNIVTVHDFGFDQQKLFIVMEHVPGTTLKSVIDQSGRLTPEQAIPLMVQACAGIGYAHRAGLVHCDVKPHNMLVTPDQRLKVTDFGIARALSRASSERSSVVWGSPLYFSPEQAAGYAPTPASDVYSLGIVLYELLTGQTPFTGRTAEALVKAHRESAPIPPSEINPDIPEALEQIILKVLSKEPAARYRTADQLGRVLLNFGNTREAPALSLTPEAAPASKPPAAPQPLRRPAPTGPIQRPVTGPINTARPAPKVATEEDALDIDWISVGLGLLAVLTVGGLIPFWIWIYYLYNPPIR
jgi:eukaryotic-like serine/threonine-protein kinase